METTSGHWEAVGQAASREEQKALDNVRSLLPDNGIFHAWANLTIVSRDGRASEIDVLLLTSKGLFVVELKGWHGEVRCQPSEWVQTAGKTIRRFDNPYKSADAKAKRVASELSDAAARVPGRPKVPFVRSLIVMHGERSKVIVDEPTRYGLWALDGYDVAGLGEGRDFSDFLSQPAADHRDLVDLARARSIIKVANEAGFKPTAKSRMVGQYILDTADVLGSGMGYQDLLATNPAIALQRRLRLFDVPPGASQADRAQIELSAKREFALTQGIGQAGVGHPGIDMPIEYLVSDHGPALLFSYDPEALPLDEFMAENGALMTLDDRVLLIRKIAEVVQYAHARNIVHRSLTPRQVYVREVAGVLTVRIRDWMLGRRTSSSSSTITVVSGGVTAVDDRVDRAWWMYLAPETLRRASTPPPIPLDIYGLGTLSFLVLTGQAPTTLAQLETTMAKEEFFDPQSVVTELADELASVVQDATRFTEAHRTATVEQFLDNLDAAVDLLESVDVKSIDDPLDVSKGDQIAGGRFVVRGRRGSGSTGIALLVDEVDGSAGLILKLARDNDAARRLAVEAQSLAVLNHPRVVRMIEGPLEVDGRSGILMTDAGRDTVADRLRAEGRATIEQLERYGADLLEAMTYLDSIGVFHRDIKPANLAISPDPGTRRPRLTLFDFSLSSESLEKTASGSIPYLDPFLGKGRRRQFDRAAELYAVSVTLFEMASGVLPWWRDGESGPAGLDDEVVVVPTTFEPAVAKSLVAFFTKALAADIADRFSNVSEMATSWLAIFADLGKEDASDGDGAPRRDEKAAAATLDTPLEDAGLSPQALSGVRRLRVATVGELIGRPPMEVNAIPGLGERFRKEVQGRIREWVARLRAETPRPAESTVGVSIERLAARLVPRPNDENGEEIELLRALTGSIESPTEVWPPLSGLGVAGLPPGAAQPIVDRAVARWRKSGLLAPIVAEVEELVAASGGAASVDELAAALLLRHGSGLEGAARVRQAAGVLRAATELDATSAEPVLTVTRPAARGSVLVGLTSESARTPVGVDPGAVVLAARSAGMAVDAALDERPVVPASTMRELIRQSMVGTDIHFDDRRVLALGVHSSASGALSSLDEVYRVTITDEEATRAALIGIPARELSIDSITRRVRQRFPEAKSVATRPRLDEIVRLSHPHLVWDGERYASHDTTGADASSVTRASTQFFITPAHEMISALNSSLQRHSALTLAVQPKKYGEAVRALSRTFDVDVVDVSLEVIRELRSEASARKVRWDVAVAADREPEGRDFSNLTTLAKFALEPWWKELMKRPTPLLITNAAPLARFGLDSLLAELTDLARPRPAARWLLVPWRASSPAPNLDGHPIPLGPDRWLTLPTNLNELTIVTTGDAA